MAGPGFFQEVTAAVMIGDACQLPLKVVFSLLTVDIFQGSDSFADSVGQGLQVFFVNGVRVQVLVVFGARRCCLNFLLAGRRATEAVTLRVEADTLQNAVCWRKIGRASCRERV